MLVYGVRWGLGNFLGFALGGVQRVGAPSRGPEAEGQDSRAQTQAAAAMHVPKSGGALGGRAEEAFLPVKARESLQNTYDFRGRPSNMPLDPRGLVVDILI